MIRRAGLLALVLAGCSCEGGGAAADGGGSGGSDGSGGTTAGDDGGPVDCADALPARRVRRLSHAEYDRTIRDLTGKELGLAAAFAPDNVVDGYANDAEALTVSGLLADQYRGAAEAVAEAMLADLDAQLPCDPAAAEHECAEAFVLAFGRRAFRRPVTEAERARWVGLFDELVAEDGFDESMRWVIAGMLQAPAFLYRTELGEPQDDGTFLLDSHELASALSYLVVGTMPDAALDADADADLLRDPEVLLGHAVRLGAREDAVVPMRSFVDAWLRTGLLEHVTRDPERYGALTEDIRIAMRGETHRLVDATWRGGGSLRDLLLSEQSFLTDELATFYGVAPGGGEADAEGYRATDVSAHYRGVLTHGSVLATHALPQSSSPIHRGLLVRERLLCNDLPPPPPGVANEPPQIEPGVSTRERYAMHSADPACAGCHRLLDPLGFGFEHYDAIGRRRADDDGVEIDASGTIVGSAQGDVEFDGVVELATLLVDSPEAQRCYARQWSTFVLGGLVQDQGLACLSEQVATGLAAADLRLDAAVSALVSAPGFARRRSDDALPPDDTTGDMPNDTGGPGEDTGTPETGGSSSGPAPEPDVEVTVTQTGTWPEGECNDVTVTNISDAQLEWEVRLVLDGAITNVWNAVATPDGDDTVFVGVDYNASIAPAASAQFGFCIAY